jgi:hypothetical protein
MTDQEKAEVLQKLQEANLQARALHKDKYAENILEYAAHIRQFALQAGHEILKATIILVVGLGSKPLDHYHVLMFQAAAHDLLQEEKEKGGRSDFTN